MTRLGINQRQRQGGFTMVELLTVIGIMSILAVVTMSSFLVLKSTALAGAGNQMVEVMTMARQNAIAKGLFTAVIVKTSGTGSNAAYCLMELSRPDTGAGGSWSNLTPWKFLPNGVIFENQSLADDTFFTNSQFNQLGIASVTFQGVSNTAPATTDFSAQCFQSDGSMLGGSAAILKLIPAVGTATNYYKLVLVANTGITKVQRP